MAVPTMPSHQRTISSVSSIGGVDDDLFQTLTGFDAFGQDDDDISFDDFEDTKDGLGMSTSTLGEHEHDGAGGAKPARKGKKQTSTAEKKATHNAVERARRESLNGRFLVLADMLPGMNSVKRASKAAIVNKSIALINDLHLRERRLAKENQALKAEIASLKERYAGQAATSNGNASGNGNSNSAAPAATSPSAMYQGNPLAAAQAQAQTQAQIHAAQAQAQAQAHAAQAHAAAMAGMVHHPGGFPMMHPAAAAAAMAHMTGSSNPASQQQQHGERSSSLPNIAMPLYPGFPAIFNPMAAYEQQQHHLQQFGLLKPENGGPSPSAHSDASHAASAPVGAGGLFDLAHGSAAAAAHAHAQATHDGQHTASPTSSYGGNPSPPGTVASLVMSDKAPSCSENGGGSGAKTATSPASSHSVPTPGNTYSPVPLPQQAFDAASHAHAHQRESSSPATSSTPAAPQHAHAHAHSSASAGASSMTNPALAAFDTSADAAYLAAQFGPRELQKAQSELQAFIAYQQRLSMGMGIGMGMFPVPGSAGAGASTANGNASPTHAQQHGALALGGMGAFGFPHQPMVGSPGLPSPSATSAQQQGMGFAFQQQQLHMQQQQQQGMPGAGAGGIPAWQSMMMAAHQQQQQQQQQAGLTTYGSLGAQY